MLSAENAAKWNERFLLNPTSKMQFPQMFHHTVAVPSGKVDERGYFNSYCEFERRSERYLHGGVQEIVQAYPVSIALFIVTP